SRASALPSARGRSRRAETQARDRSRGRDRSARFSPGRHRWLGAAARLAVRLVSAVLWDRFGRLLRVLLAGREDHVDESRYELAAVTRLAPERSVGAGNRVE